MPNRASDHDFRALFEDCEDIKREYILLEQSWAGKGNYGAIYRCQRRSSSIRSIDDIDVDCLDSYTYKELQRVVPEIYQERDFEFLRCEVYRIKTHYVEGAHASGEATHSPARSRGNRPRAETLDDTSTLEGNSVVVKIIPLEGAVHSNMSGNRWMTASQAASEEDKLSRMHWLRSSADPNQPLLKTPKIRDRFKTAKALFIVMDFIDGQTLSRLADDRFFSKASEARTNFPALADLAFQLIRTVLQVHIVDLIHLDIKPENVMREIKQPEKNTSSTAASGAATQEQTTAAEFDDLQLKNMWNFTLPFTQSDALSNIDTKTTVPNDHIQYEYSLVDFGVCTKVDDSNSSQRGKRGVFLPRGRGTPGYIAPEVDSIVEASSGICSTPGMQATEPTAPSDTTNSSSSVGDFIDSSGSQNQDDDDDAANYAYYTPACDCWSVGATLYTMVFGSLLRREDFKTEKDFIAHCERHVRSLSGDMDFSFRGSGSQSSRATYASVAASGSASAEDAVLWTDTPFHLIYCLTDPAERLRMNLEKAICHPFLIHHGKGFTSDEEVQREIFQMHKLHDIAKFREIQMLGDVTNQKRLNFTPELKENFALEVNSLQEQWKCESIEKGLNYAQRCRGRSKTNSASRAMSPSLEGLTPPLLRSMSDVSALSVASTMSNAGSVKSNCATPPAAGGGGNGGGSTQGSSGKQKKTSAPKKDLEKMRKSLSGRSNENVIAYENGHWLTSKIVEDDADEIFYGNGVRPDRTSSRCSTKSDTGSETGTTDSTHLTRTASFGSSYHSGSPGHANLNRIGSSNSVTMNRNSSCGASISTRKSGISCPNLEALHREKEELEEMLCNEENRLEILVALGEEERYSAYQKLAEIQAKAEIKLDGFKRNYHRFPLLPENGKLLWNFLMSLKEKREQRTKVMKFRIRSGREDTQFVTKAVNTSAPTRNDLERLTEDIQAVLKTRPRNERDQYDRKLLGIINAFNKEMFQANQVCRNVDATMKRRFESLEKELNLTKNFLANKKKPQKDLDSLLPQTNDKIVALRIKIDQFFELHQENHSSATASSLDLDMPSQEQLNSLLSPTTRG